MAYVRRHWVDYPSTETPIDADALNNIEDGIEESHNIQLLAVTDTAPSECAEGDKYYDTTTRLIYTATGTDEWGETGETPIADILYIVLDEQSTYTYDGTDLVSVGGGNGGETLPVGSEIDYDGTTVPTGWEETTPIIDSGTNYVRFYDGTQIAWKKVNATAGGNAWAGTGIYYSDHPMGDWEKPFTSIFSIWSGVNASQYWATAYNTTMTSAGSVRVFRPNNSTLTVDMYVTAIGRWK